MWIKVLIVAGQAVDRRSGFLNVATRLSSTEMMADGGLARPVHHLFQFLSFE